MCIHIRDEHVVADFFDSDVVNSELVDIEQLSQMLTRVFKLDTCILIYANIRTVKFVESELVDG